MLALPTITAANGWEYQTLKAAGGNYTKMSDFEGQNRNLVTEEKGLCLTCDNLQDPQTASTGFVGWTTDVNRPIYIRAADKHLSKGAWTTNAYRMKPTLAGSATLTLGTLGANGVIYFEGIQFFNDTASAACITPSGGSAGSKAYFINCIIHTDKAGGMGAYTGSTAIRLVFINCIIISEQSHAVHNSASTPGDEFYNCVLWSRASGYGLYTFATLPNIIKNTYIGGASGAIFSTFASSTLTNVATSDADSPTAALRNCAFSTTNFVNVTAGSYDLRTKAGSVLLNGGAAPDYPYDLAEELRNPTTPDIGALELVPYSAHRRNSLFVMGW